MHIKREPIVCYECGKGFEFKITYQEHIKLHTGVKDLKCCFCDKFFRRRDAWFRNETVHKGVKHHDCKICNKKFMQRNTLNVHTKRHLNQKDHKCHQCGKGFIEPGGLRKHKRQHANRESLEVYFEKGSNSQLLKKKKTLQVSFCQRSLKSQVWGLIKIWVWSSKRIPMKISRFKIFIPIWKGSPKYY